MNEAYRNTRTQEDNLCVNTHLLLPRDSYLIGKTKKQHYIYGILRTALFVLNHNQRLNAFALNLF